MEYTSPFSKDFVPAQQSRCSAEDLLTAAALLGQPLDEQRRLWEVQMANLNRLLAGSVCHLALSGFVYVNSKMRLPLSLFAPFQKGLKNVFDEAILAALEPPEPKKTRRCVLL